MNQFIDLQKILEAAQPGFAYKMLMLQMNLDNQKKEKDLNDISQLTALYMLGLEVLQSNSDNRFHYFYKKIQNLLFKNQVIEKLKKASGCIESKPANQKRTFTLQQRRDIYQTEVENTKKMHADEETREIIKSAEFKLERYNGSIRKNLESQQNILAQRISQRKLRSLSRKRKQFTSGKIAPMIQQFRQQQQLDKPYSQYFGACLKEIKQPQNPIKDRKNNFL